jgi:hypothetical protein
MRIHRRIAATVRLESEATVAAKRIEHMVEKGHSGLSGHWPAIKIDNQVNASFRGTS